MRFAWMLLLLAFAEAANAAEKADLLIRNARIYTVDAAQPWTSAVAIRGERILWTGEERDSEAYVGDATRTLDAAGRLILPGFIDSHFHVLFGSNPDVLPLQANSLAEIRSQLAAFANRRPELPWIEGQGWNYSAFADGTLPTAEDLQGLAGDRPMFLTSYDYHTVWMNREALRRFGITRETGSVSFAEHVEKDPRTGEPTGILNGFGSAGLSAQAESDLRAQLPSHSLENVARSIRENLAAAVRAGITTVVEPQSFLENLPTYRQLLERGELPVRLQVALFHRRGTSDADLSLFAQAQKQYDTDRLRVSAIKLYIDDVIEPHTAAMLAPYADRPGESGKLLYAPQEFAEVVTRLDRMKFQLFIHAIGDRGIRTALDALESARKTNGARDSRHQLVHIECLSPDDVDRFRQLEVTACMQPRHSAPDITGQWALAVGPERAKHAWALRSLRDAGALLAFASDWNVAEMEPVIGIYTALTRKGLDGKPVEGWIPEQRIDLETAVRGYTLNGARANFLEANRGSISAGKYADLVMLSEDLFRIPAERIKDVRVVLTLVGGREAYRE